MPVSVRLLPLPMVTVPALLKLPLLTLPVVLVVAPLARISVSPEATPARVAKASVVPLEPL